MRLAEPWACFRATAWLVLCSLLLALPACTGISPGSEHGLDPFARRTRPQRAVRRGRPVVRTAHAAPPDAAATTGADEEKLFRDFVEWQDAQGSAR